MKISQKRLDEIAKFPDKSIDTSDIPELDSDFWKRAKVVMPEKKVPVSLRLDQKVLEWYKRQGKGYQSRMNAVLTSYMRVQDSL